jgi:hypothetical protein
VTAGFVVSAIICGFLFCCVILCIMKKCHTKQRIGVLPLSTQMVIAEQENQYAPPSYYQVPSYSPPPPYSTLSVLS